MIDFDLDPALELLRETARRFGAERLRPRERESEAARAVGAPNLAAAAEIGLAAAAWPESLGGAALGALGRAVVLEELAAADPGAALALDPLGPAVHALAELGGEPALRTHAGPLIGRPGARAWLAWNGDGRVTLRGGRADGRLPWVPADRLDLLVLLDRDAAAVVEADGLPLAPLRGAGLRAAGASEVVLAGAPVRAWWVHPRGARRALARARLDLAALLVGVARAAAELSRAYALQRVAFGRPIAHHQALAFLIADMASAVDGARLLVHDAALRLDAEEDADGACAAAFVEAAEQALFVTPNALQILGGHGFVQDYPIEKWMREARALSLLHGGVDAAREDAGRALVASDAPLALAGTAPR
ncbi:MAG: acyl-CoA dehydrogenase [Deltaproteobacteria bacterium]|nr:acyl-CoA dehydrogenase [Deltaproteobacteria bacterium]